ncbi:MAG: cyclic nucleotide-binding domain-containing protein [Gemmatimonadetes bacterium]|nr:cyclic nucleotide-binding domain-containing protein [Gemmatimonadota bacterium]
MTAAVAPRPSPPTRPSLLDFTADEVLIRLCQIEILRALPPEEIQALVPHVDFARLSKGTILMHVGDPGDALYFIETGRVRVERPAAEPVFVDAGGVVGEAALLTGDPRTATVTADTDVEVWVIAKLHFDELVGRSPVLRQALQLLVEARRQGTPQELPSEQFWVSTALRAIDARYQGLTGWQRFMGIGLLIWTAMYLNERFPVIPESRGEVWFAVGHLLSGLLIVQGACEAFVQGVERLGARLKWDGFISGTVGSLLSTLPEFVVIAFLVTVEPLAAFVTAAVTIFNNALVFSIYAFFLPKDRKGTFAMPRSLTIAGGEIMIAGATITLLVGIVMLVLRVATPQTALRGVDLIGIGIVLMAIYAYYVLTLVRYYAEGKDDEESLPPDPERLGHDVTWDGIGLMFLLGVIGAYTAGEAIGEFAETALDRLGLPTIPTAAALAFFAGVSEYIIVFKSHRRGELGIALSNAFGGLTQVMFLLLPFAMMTIGVLGLAGAGPQFVIPLNEVTMLLVLLLFPLFFALHQHMEQEGTLSNLDAASMTGAYLLLLYFLFTASPS